MIEVVDGQRSSVSVNESLLKSDPSLPRQMGRSRSGRYFAIWAKYRRADLHNAGCRNYFSVFRSRSRRYGSYTACESTHRSTQSSACAAIGQMGLIRTWSSVLKIIVSELLRCC